MWLNRLRKPSEQRNTQGGAVTMLADGEHSRVEEHIGESPIETWNADLAKHTLDELFSLTSRYKASKDYRELIRFVARFRFYSPYNAMLVHIQMPGATYVAPAYRWLRDYGRWIKPEARPLVILRPMGPVMFVFDVSDTEGEFLPMEVDRPFETTGVDASRILGRLLHNCPRDGIDVHVAKYGSQQAGEIQVASGPPKSTKFRGKPVRICYTVKLNQDLNAGGQYASLVHELAHLYCGHLGTSNPRWWPDRQGLSRDIAEFEAESVAYLVCARFGIANPSEKYLADYVGQYETTPPLSLDRIMRASGIIEKMSKEKLKPRRTPARGRSR